VKAKAVRLHGKNDLRLDQIDLPEMKNDEILAKVISDSLCMSSYKAASQGENHKRVPNNVAEKPIIIGHEFCGEIVQVGEKWQNKFRVGQKFTIQTALNHPSDPYAAPGYSFQYIGGDSTYVLIPSMVMELDCLLDYQGDAYFYGSIAEPMSCIIGAFHAAYHTKTGVYEHEMGIKKGGKCAILAGAGPMGLGAVDYALHCDRKPSLLVVTDIDNKRLERAAKILTVEEAAKNGVKLMYVNTSEHENPEEYLKSLTDNIGFDDVFVYAPVKSVVEQGDKILAFDGCLNFFAGPTDTKFSAEFNFYNVHYSATHIVGTSGGNTDDMKEALSMMEKGLLNPAAMVTHIGGLDSVSETTLNLPKIPGGKKLIYNQISMPLTAIDDIENIAVNNVFMEELAQIIAENNGLWSLKAEKWLLKNAKSI